MTTQDVEVRFKGNRRAWFQWDTGTAPRLQVNDGVVVKVEHGLDFGWVNRNTAATSSCDGCTSCDPTDPPADPPATATATASPTPSADVVRRATPRDIARHQELRREEDAARRHVMERARHHDLPMRISDTEWQWDGHRLAIYFTAERRVDFRDLVRELATHFRTRIDLRQIGARNEAARLGGVGRCGREYCCSTWLNEPPPVTLALAKDQRLSLNPGQISGGCGRLLCCLKYEHEFYLDSRKRFPKEGKTIQTAQGAEKVIAVDIFRERVYLRGADAPGRVIPLVQLQAELAGETLPPPPPPPPPVELPATVTPDTAAPTAKRRSRRRRRGSPPRNGPTT